MSEEIKGDEDGLDINSLASIVIAVEERLKVLEARLGAEEAKLLLHTHNASGEAVVRLRDL